MKQNSLSVCELGLIALLVILALAVMGKFYG